MEKVYIMSMLLLLSLPILSHAENGFPYPNEKVTSLLFYVQDILTGPKPTNINVAAAKSTSSSPTRFGLVSIIDDPIRMQPATNSEIVGRAQGILAFASLEERSLHMSFDLVFTSGEHSGSVLTLAGHNPYLRDHRELSIVGGSGGFRAARGFVGVRTVSFNSVTGDAFFEYNATVIHY